MDPYNAIEDTKPDHPAVREFTVAAEDAGTRLDQFLSARMEHSRSQIQDWIETGRVMWTGGTARASSRLKAEQRILVEIPPLEPAHPEAETGIPLAIVYEDPHLVVVDKQRGLTVHPGSGAPSGTLVNALLAHCTDLSGIRGIERPGIVHRLDKNTSGLIVVAKNDQAHYHLQRQFQDRTVGKIYVALVHGVPSPPRGTIQQPIGRHKVDRKRMAVLPDGRPARTDYEVLERFGKDYAYLDLHLHTGRTHQIRVHLTWLGHPLVGDTHYGRRPNPWGLVGQFLHCRRLEITHPVSGVRLELEAALPRELEAILRDLRGIATLES